MTEPPLIQDPPQDQPQEAIEPMRLPARLMNVFAVPGDVFDYVKRTPNAASSWLVPMLIACLTAALCSVILFSQDPILQQMRQMRVAEMDKAVDAGKMTREQADQAMQVTDRFATPTILKIGGSIGGSAAVVVGIFWWALVVWLMSLIFVRNRIPYLKALEVAGLASLVTTLGMVIQLLLQINMGSIMATPSAGLLISEYDPANPLHGAMSALNPIRLWMVLLLGMGLAKLADIQVTRAALLMIAAYALQTSILVLMGAGMAMV